MSLQTSSELDATRWYVYLLECQRGTYVGITNNLAKRYRAHLAGKGARYTRANPPQALLGAQPFADRSAASRAEYQLKQQTPIQKRHWAKQWPFQLITDEVSMPVD